MPREVLIEALVWAEALVQARQLRDVGPQESMERAVRSGSLDWLAAAAVRQ